MTRHRTIILIVGSLVAFAGISSDAALASSLLSGYGGPGQGNQALLGSALLNGPGGGGGSAGAAAAPSASIAPTTAEAPSRSARRGSAGRSRPSHKHAGAGQAGSKGAAASSQTSSPTRISDIYAAAERGASAPSTGVLGLSGADFLLIVLALLTLGFTGVLTRRLTRSAPAGRQR
ncbi:MAG TPA: hypothetical protein VGO29_13920 [Solirubrobacteraceae bacterium]|jgi:hypothetical protein|nr:hypothetical protein [Solirubrobacteraceae bacterium]